METIGHNKREDETVLEYIKRVMNSDYLYNTTDFAVAEFCPYHMKFLNSNFELSNETYYFSIAAGIKNRNRMKQREMMK